MHNLLCTGTLILTVMVSLCVAIVWVIAENHSFHTHQVDPTDPSLLLLVALGPEKELTEEAGVRFQAKLNRGTS